MTIHVLDGRTQPDFYDLGHTGAQTPPIIAAKMAQVIFARLPLLTAHNVSLEITQLATSPAGQSIERPDCGTFAAYFLTGL